jgi:soluble lytic murein transglycosylase-like protein
MSQAIWVGYVGGAKPIGIGTARNLKAAKEMARKWGALFDVPPAWLLTISAIESQHDPSKVNMAAKSKGGAWGLYQQMLDEVPYKVGVIQKHHAKRSPIIAKTVKMWRGDPYDLLHPDLNAMIAAWQLGRLRKIFGDKLETVAAAYHQGENAVKRRVAQGLPPVSEKQPSGMEYVSRTMTNLPQYELLAMAD